jgi:hypothetical protein
LHHGVKKPNSATRTMKQILLTLPALLLVPFSSTVK